MDQPTGTDLTPDELVQALAPDTQELDAFALIGFLGGGRAGHVRLYQDHELKVWVDIPEADIIHRRRIPAELDTFGGRSIIWVKGEALRTAVDPGLVEALAEQFRIGPLAAENLLPRTLEHALDRLLYKPPTTRCSPKCP